RAGNALKREAIKTSFFTADSLYQAIGQHWQDNPDLESKKLFLLHTSCHGESALNAFHYLPEKSRIFYYSLADSLSSGTDNEVAFSQAFRQLKQNSHSKNLTLTPDVIVAAATIGTNNLFPDQ